MGFNHRCHHGRGFLRELAVSQIHKVQIRFLTAHQTYFIIFVYLAVVIEVIPNPNKSMLILLGGLLTGLYCTLSPALVQPFMRKVTGTDDLAYGHTTSFGVIVGSWVGNVFKSKKDESSEDMKIPESLYFLKDITVSTAVVMVLLYVICVALAGPPGSKPISATVRLLTCTPSYRVPNLVWASRSY
jgi:PTS system ascorbate-specific IIC component